MRADSPNGKTADNPFVVSRARVSRVVCYWLFRFQAVGGLGCIGLLLAWRCLIFFGHWAPGCKWRNPDCEDSGPRLGGLGRGDGRWRAVSRRQRKLYSRKDTRRENR